jgi:hypothetical protein
MTTPREKRDDIDTDDFDGRKPPISGLIRAGGLGYNGRIGLQKII